MKKKREELLNNLKKLEDIVSWFEDSDDVDLEAGLEKAKTGAELVKALRTEMEEVQNEFEEIKKELEDEVSE